MSMSTLGRRSLTVAVALALVTGLPTAAAAGASGPDCEKYRASSTPVVHPAVDVGFVQLCDEDDDEVFDTVRFDTRGVPADGVVSVTSEEHQRSDHRDDRTQATARVSPSTPGGPIVYQKLVLADEGDNGNVETVNSEGGVYTSEADTTYVLGLIDGDDDGEYESYALLVCSPDGTCVAPSPSMVPGIPDRVDLPDLVFRVEPIGYIP